MFTFFDNNLDSFTMFEIIFELSFIIDTFRIILFSVSLSFTSNKLASIIPKHFISNHMDKNTLSMLYTVFDLTFINIHCLAISFCDHHPFIVYTFTICVVNCFVNSNFILNFLTINDKFQTSYRFD